MTQKVRQQIAHEDKNLINLDSDEVSVSIEPSDSMSQVLDEEQTFELKQEHSKDNTLDDIFFDKLLNNIGKTDRGKTSPINFV